MKTPPTDLTTLAQKNGGKYPSVHIATIIRGIERSCCWNFREQRSAQRNVHQDISSYSPRRRSSQLVANCSSFATNTETSSLSKSRSWKNTSSDSTRLYPA